MDYKKLTSVHTQISDATKKEQDELEAKRRQAIKDAVAKHRKMRKRAADSKNRPIRRTPSKTTSEGRPKVYSTIKDSGSYKTLLRRVKDELSATEDTEAAIDVAIDLLHDAPAEQVLAATVEVLGEAIDTLQEVIPADPEEQNYDE